jgi:hypothetical protein
MNFPRSSDDELGDFSSGRQLVNPALTIDGPMADPRKVMLSPICASETIESGSSMF